MPTLHFKGKPLVQNHHLVVPFSELEAVKSRGLSKTPSLHDNLIIEGDNLKALKALLPTYHGKVKCIYIDPPYNTGNEGWIYNDRVNSPMMRDWLGRTVDRDDLTRHDKWCCMMLPRLKLLRELLTDDGAIFVSIDDNEVHHLRALMDEVFGEENFVANGVWQKSYTPNQTARFISDNHDHIVIYARNAERYSLGKFHRTIEQRAKFKNPDNDPRKLWKPENLSAGKFYEAGQFTIIGPTGKKFNPPKGRYWRCDEEQFEAWRADNRIWFGKTGTGRPMLKKFLEELTTGLTPSTWWEYSQFGGNKEATAELKEIFGGEAVFASPKPTKLLRKIFELATDQEAVILDSFAGSGTTAHAVLALNKEDGGNRRFILCQMPFETKEQEQKKENICESITAERVRRVIKGVPKAKDEALRAGLGGTFSYFHLGKELRKQAILDGKDLPSYEALAGYVFFTATGDEFEPKKMKRPFIGTSRDRDVFLIYEQDIEKLKDMALNLDLARKLGKAERKKLVFAPTKYLDQEYLDRLNIEFCQLPFEIYQRATKK
jgi:adenine-specific DNA-methyltransferase